METYNINELSEGATYKAYPEELFTFKASKPEFRIIQGAVFDGETYYAAVNAKSEGFEATTIVVMDKNGKVLRESPELLLDHANCITRSPDGKLFITHCQSPDDHFNRYSLVDPESFEIIKTEDLEKPFFAMAYSEDAERFGSGQWAGQTLNVWDKDLKLLKDENVAMPSSLSQGMCCTKEGLYFVRSFKNGSPTEIRHYSWELELVFTVIIDVSEQIEVEDINIVDGEAYVIAADPDRSCGVAYKMKFEY